MARKILCLILLALFSALTVCGRSQAISVFTENDTDLGVLEAGKPLFLTVNAEDYAGLASKVIWKAEYDGTYRPGFKLSSTKGRSVTLRANSLKKPGNADGNFSVTLTATDKADGNMQSSVTFTGTVMESPKLSTTKLAATKAGSGKLYNAKIELKSGTEPITWEISADIPGIAITEELKASGKKYYLLSGDPERAGDYPVKVHVENEIGSEDRKYTLKVTAVKPKITVPSGFIKKYTVKISTDISIDVSGLEITGTRPISIDIDDKSKAAGLYYDSADKMIKGKITDIPRNERLNVKLQAINPATEIYGGKHNPVTLALTVNVKSPPGRIIVPALFLQYNAHYDSYATSHVYATIGRSLNTSFKTEGGSKPITWDFIVSDRTTSYGRDIGGKSIIKDLDGKFMGLTFSSNGAIRGVVDPSYNNYHDIDLSFNVIAYNEAGSQDITNSTWEELNTDDFWTFNIYAGLPPAFDKSKTAKAIPILNGSEVNISLDQYLDWEAMTRWKGAPIYIATSEDILKYEYGRRWVSPITGETHIDYPYTEVRPSFSTASQLPNGLKVVSRHYILGVSHDKGASITGTVNVSSSGLKKYPISFTVQNAFGKVRGTITLDVQEMPEIDPNGTITDDKLTSSEGKSYRLQFPTTTKRPYVWTLQYDGKTVQTSGQIGASGLTWSAANAMITGTNRSVKAGTYDIKILLSNDVGIASKDYTITVNSRDNTALPAGRRALPENVSIPENGSESPETVSMPENHNDMPENGSESENHNDMPETDSPENIPALLTVNGRGVSELSGRVLSAVSNDSYMIAAILPEVSCTESGMYDIEAELFENVPAGSELVWFAFPKDGGPSDDEASAMFIDDTGKEITSVPANRKITVSVWLNKTRVYEPVIAVKK